jgi:hypothetical protein
MSDKRLLVGFMIGIVFSILAAASWHWLEVPMTKRGPKNSKVDPSGAIGRLTIGNTGCTGTIIGPLEDTDTEVHILTAAHCIQVGSSGTMKLKDGREIPFRCVSRDQSADCAWCIGTRPSGQLSIALLAKQLPKVGEKVWHQGYGIDKPGNHEEGSYLGLNADGSQCLYSISVSSGDSGGGIIEQITGGVLSPVCCTTNRGGPGKVWGASPFRSAAIRPGGRTATSEENGEHPTLILPDGKWPNKQYINPLP